MDSKAQAEFRIGRGLDVHRFSEGRKLVLGGVEIAAEEGLLGHSDADALLHAITDAVLGALAWGDIGSWFPDTSPEHKDADSRKLFRQVWQKAQAEGWSLVNCDSTVMTEKPKLRPHIEKLRASIAELFVAELSVVSVKATTSEQMGFIGRGEGLLAEASVLLKREKTSCL